MKNCHRTTNLAAVLRMPAAKALRGLPDRSAQKYPTMESSPHNLLSPKHLHLFRHLRIHPGTTRHLLRSAARKAPLRGQHSRNENPPMHLAWRPEQRPRVHLAWLPEVA
ncbi:hypothetical protein MTO96_037321 [Rhipicephalus appendiculatus]